MKQLVLCVNCGSQISDTALKCPICWKDTGTPESLAKKIGLSAAGGKNGGGKNGVGPR